MEFSRLPLGYRLFLFALGPLTAGAGWLASKQLLPLDWPLTGLLCVYAILASAWNVDWRVRGREVEIPFGLTCIALLLLGPQAALYTSLAGVLGRLLLFTNRASWHVTAARPRFYQLFSALSLAAIPTVLAASTQSYILPRVTMPLVADAVALGAFTAAYGLIRVVLFTLDESLRTRGSLRHIWTTQLRDVGYSLGVPALGALVLVPLPTSGQLYLLLGMVPAWTLCRGQQIHLARVRMLSDKMEQDMARIRELSQLNRTIMASLCTAIDAKDSYTSSHINRVQTYAIALAKAVGLGTADMEAVATGALVHDIGKLGIPDHILGKPGKLTQEEFKRIQSHVNIGVEILSPIPFAFPVLEVVRSHHERWDGLGYPQGLRGELIPVGARIISIVDVFDALTSDRPYRKALSHDAALEIIHEGSGKQFDPLMVELFDEVLPAARLQIQQMEANQKRRARANGAAGDTGQALSQIKHAAAEMAAVADVAHALAQQETLDAIAKIVAERTLNLLPADTAVIYLKDPERGELVATAVAGRYAEKFQGMTINLGEGACGWVVANQQARVNATAALDVARRFTPEENLELSTVTAVPLVHGPDTLGALAVYTVGYSVIQEPHLYVLNALAEHAAGAIQNHLRFVEHRDLAYSDPLTGLVNSRGLYREMDRLLAGGGAADTQRPFSIVMMDLDHFKDVNDTLGHLRGDDLLRTVAQALTTVSRPGDIVCRYAGDEFVLILTGVVAEQAERVARRAREAIESQPLVDDRIKIGASIGLASYPADGVDSRALLHAADLRMYEDKLQRKSGRGMVETLSERGSTPEPSAPKDRFTSPLGLDAENPFAAIR